MELSGAERCFILLGTWEKGGSWAESLGIMAGEEDEVKMLAAPLLQEAQTSWKPVLRDEMGEALEGDVPELHQRSALALPLLTGGKVRGLLYGDMRHIFGRFEQRDVDMLSLLANQAASALENADWSFTLEQKVERRTEQLQSANSSLKQRNAELAIINKVQEGLVAELDIQAIYDLAGEQISEIFPQADAGIRIIDNKSNLIHFPFAKERGQRQYLEPIALGGSGFTAHVLTTRRPLLVNENVEDAIREYGSSTIPGADMEKSALFVPLIVDEEVRGIIDLIDMEREHAFTEGDVRLLTTLANSLSLALENARLFDETHRLLQETEQRNAELAIINKVQEGLVAELDMGAIYGLIGDTIRDIFDAQVVMICRFDHDAEQIHIAYLVEEGQRHQGLPIPFNELHRHLIRTRETVLINENALEAMERFGLHTVPGTKLSKTLLFVPLLVGDMVNGFVSLQNIDREHAFTDSDVRLLKTLANGMSMALENARLFRGNAAPRR